MRNQTPMKSSPNGYVMDAYTRSREHAVRGSSETKGMHRGSSVTPTHTNKKSTLMADEERQDLSIGNEEVQKSELEYEILCKEIDRIDQKFRAGADESKQKITLTSTFMDDAEISQTMHEKLMRLIKAMIPNSTAEEKSSFIRDLFEMGLRVSSNSSTRSQIEQRFGSVENHLQSSTDEFMIDDSNSIIDSSNEDSMRQKSKPVIYNPHLDEGLKSSSSLDEYIDGANSILASMDECDTLGVEMATSIHQSVSSRRYLTSQATNSSDAVDVRWEQLRDKMLNDSRSGRTKNSLTSEMEANLIHECVETDLVPFKTKIETNSQRTVDSIQNSLKRPGRADESSTNQPTQQRVILSDSFSIDCMSNSIVQTDEVETNNIPSFDEASVHENDPKSSEETSLVNPTHMNSSEDSKVIKEEEARKEENVNSNKPQQKHEITLHPLKDKLKIRISGSGSSDAHNSKNESISDGNTPVMQNQSVDGSSRRMVRTSNPKISGVESANDSTTVEHNQSMDQSSHNMENLIFVQSSLTGITELVAPRKEANRSFYQSIHLSITENFENDDNEMAEVVPSWRLNPQESHSDFMLTVLSSETGTATNYHVHKHMMAVGPKSSQYMSELFTSENASNFQLTLDGKTSPIIPEILDFMYCHDHDISITTENAVAFRQVSKMLKIAPLELKAANFILEDMAIENLVTYVSDCCYFNDAEVTKAVVEKCTSNIESISVDDRLWIVMEPELFRQIISSPHIDRGMLSKKLSILLKEYLDLHQYEIDVNLFVTLTSENLIPLIDRSAALPLIELSDSYSSDKCAELQKRCAFTIACYWQTTPQAERHRLFALLRHLPSSITVDFLEIVESGHSTLEMLRSEMEHQTISGYVYVGDKQKPMTIQDFCGDLVKEDHKKEKLSWRMDPTKSYSDMAIRVEYSNYEGSQVYYVHKQIVAVGPNRSRFLSKHLKPREGPAGEEVIIDIKLDYEGSSVVPQVLDFMYSQDTALEISNENSVGLQYVSRAFEISTLSREIIKFIDHDLTLENIADYIIDGGYYRDHSIIATAGRFCAQEIMSIDVGSDLLTDLEPDFFEKVVSSDVIEKTSRHHVNLLITKYIDVRDLEDDMIEKLLESIEVDEIDKNSVLHLLKTVITLIGYDGVETLQTIKKKSIDVITENWNELTSDNHRRQEIFLMMPSFPSHLIANIFDAVDSKARKEQRESVSKQAMLENLCRERVAEANRMREKEVSRLQEELEKQRRAMISLEMEMEEKLFHVDKVLVRPTASNGAVIPKSPTQRNSIQFSEVKNDLYGRAHEPERDWYNNQGGGNDAYGKMDEMDGMEMVADVFHNPDSLEKISDGSGYSDNRASNYAKAEEENSICDQQSVSTAHVQKKKGRRCCC